MAIRFRILIALIVLAIASPGKADSPARPRSYKTATPGGQFVFVMIAPVSVETEVRRWNEGTAAGIREIRKQYERSGMYHNDGSVVPIWTVDWYAFHVDLAPDGIHLIRQGPWAWLNNDESPDLTVEAVSFFANGQPLRTYSVGELVDRPGRVERTVSHYQWQRDGQLFGNSEYAITTLDGNRFVFDVRTGGIVTESRSIGDMWLVLWASTVVVVVTAMSVLFVWWKKRTRRVNTEFL